MKTAHAYLRLLEAKRSLLERSMADHEITEAGCEVFDELMWRLRMITDHIPEDAPLTRSLIEKANNAYEILTPVMATAARLDELLVEGLEAISLRREPFARLLKRIESEGFFVTEALDEVTDATDWSSVEHSDPAAQVMLEAEKIARAEQANLYQERVNRVAENYHLIDTEYAQRIRDLIKPGPDIIRSDL